MKIVEKKVSELVPYPDNPRKNDGAIPAVEASIKQFGYKVPIVIDRNNVIVTGHTRLAALKKLGIKTVSCVLADDLTDEQVKAFRLADNKTAELAEWDFDKLDKELSSLMEEGDIDMTPFGFEEPEEEEPEEGPDYYGAERERTMDAYNLHDYDETRTAGPFQLPTLKRCKTAPKKLIGFNYMLTTDPEPGLGVHFYIDDYQFERVWNDPTTYCEKLAAFDYVLTPDFSLYMDMPMAMKIWNVYRSRLIGQILQDMGVKVIPTLQWAEEATFKFCFDGIEPGGVVSISSVGIGKDKEAMNIWRRGVEEAEKQLHPSHIVFYGRDLGYKSHCPCTCIEPDTFKRGGA